MKPIRRPTCGLANRRAEQIEERLKGDAEAIGLVFDWSMVDYVERYLTDERLQMAYLGQGVIGTFASPFDKGTASVNYHHSSGHQGGLAGTWGYVRGGMGMVSFILCDIARDLGAVVTTGTPVARILPGEGVELEGGERIHAPVIVSNADPRTALRLLGNSADPSWRAQVEVGAHRGVQHESERGPDRSCRTSRPAPVRTNCTITARSTRR